jgi:hypothetical protein
MRCSGLVKGEVEGRGGPAARRCSGLPEGEVEGRGRGLAGVARRGLGRSFPFLVLGNCIYYLVNNGHYTSLCTIIQLFSFDMFVVNWYKCTIAICLCFFSWALMTFFHQLFHHLQISGETIDVKDLRATFGRYA